MMRSQLDFPTLAASIVRGSILPGPLEVTLEDFRILYEEMLRATGNRVPHAVVISLGDQAFVQFPEYSPQDVILRSKTFVVPEDLSFVTLKDWKGSREPRQTFPCFLAKEVASKPVRIALVGLISFIALILTGPTSATLDLLSSLLIQASTVFLSIYLIFTVSQSARLSYDKKLFASGTLHRYYSHDSNITSFGIMTVGVVFANAALSHVRALSVSPTGEFTLPGATWLLAFTTTVAVTMLFHTFFLVAGYYLERGRDVAERDQVAHILHDEYSSRHPDEQD